VSKLNEVQHFLKLWIIKKLGVVVIQPEDRRSYKDVPPVWQLIISFAIIKYGRGAIGRQCRTHAVNANSL